MIRLATVLALLAALAAPMASAQADCGVEIACEVPGGSYHLIRPEGWDRVSPRPAVIFFHGFRSSGASVLRGGLREAFGAAGYVIIAPNGAFREGTDIRAWPARPSAEPARDDIAFTRTVVEDAARRLPIDQDRILVSGFSAGGSMAWMVACYEGPRYAGYVSVAGALRRPTPEERCPGGPARLMQVHGFSDAQAPLEGRGIRDWHQGDVFESLSLLRRTNGCRSNPDEISVIDRFWRRVWNESCASGQDIELLMHPGGHMLPKGWAEAALAWFERDAPGVKAGAAE